MKINKSNEGEGHNCTIKSGDTEDSYEDFRRWKVRPN